MTGNGQPDKRVRGRRSSVSSIMDNRQIAFAATALWLVGLLLILTTPAWFPFMESLAGSPWDFILFWWWPIGGVVWAALAYSRAQTSTQPPPPTGAP